MTVLKIEKRDIAGSVVRKLRRDGILPGVVYGNGESLNVQFSTNEFVRVYKSIAKIGDMILDLDGKQIPCVIKSVDVHPVKGVPRHVDFLIKK